MQFRSGNRAVPLHSTLLCSKVNSYLLLYPSVLCNSVLDISVYSVPILLPKDVKGQP